MTTGTSGSFRAAVQAANQTLSLLPLWLALALAVAFATAGGASAQRNVASDRPYTLSAEPNYETARANAATVLTDGREAGGSYWLNGTTLGWRSLTPVIVSIGLAEPTSVGRLQVQAGAKTSGEIYYPSQILAFGGDGTGRFAFLGATELQRDRDSPDPGALRAFDIGFPPRMMREIVVIAFARGPFLFLGEIAAYGADGGTPLTGDLASIDAVRADAIARRRGAIAALPMPVPAGPAITQRWAMPLIPRPDNPAEAAETGCQATRVEPWPDRAGGNDPLPADTPLLASAGGRDYAAFRIVNAASAPAKVSLSGKGKDQVALRWYALAHAQALDYSWVPDVAAPFENGVLPPRSSMTVLAEIEPGRAGEGRATLAISCADAVAHFDMPMRAVALGEMQPLHANLWTYIHEPQHLPAARALACQPDFLSRFHIDTGVIHPSALMDAGGIAPTDLLTQYFKAYRGTRRVLLFMDVKTKPWAFRKMPDGEAAQTLRRWWDWVQGTAKASGYKGEIILYPIDEPQPSDVRLLLKTRDLLRQAGVKARVYATAEQKTAPLLGSLDILQLHRPTAAQREALKSAELHGYDTRRDSKLLSVNGYYRMQGWQAFDLDLAGTGLWSAWDGSGLGDPASGWNPFVGTRERDFGMLYVSPEGCGWPSRRLLAWRRGLEENRILKSCVQGERAGEYRRLVSEAVAKESAGAARQALERIALSCSGDGRSPAKTE